MNRKVFCIFMLVIITCVVASFNCYAVTEADVQAAVDGSSKEEVSGNILIWFLCAIAFMKVSQKIDTFLSALGISIGRTGGSLMGEVMMVGKALGAAFKSGGKFAGFGKNGSSGGSGFGGFLGGIGRKMRNGAADSITGKNTGFAGVLGSIGKKLYNSSLGKSGSFAAGVISSIARGDIGTMGTISGADGKLAMESYFGYNASASVDKKEGNDSSLRIDNGGKSTITNEDNVNGTIDFAGTPPSFSDIEMGGGRITGIETSEDHPGGIEFAMYDAEKYAKPEGKYETVTAVDNSKWYKQYASPAVEKEPYMGAKGKIQYNEKIVNKIPKAPMRKDRM